MDTSSAPRTTEGGAPGGRAATPSWAAIAAWGGGLIQLALGAGAITGVGGGLALQAVGILLTVLGAAALGWGAARSPADASSSRGWVWAAPWPASSRPPPP